jgi:spore germination protein KB
MSSTMNIEKGRISGIQFLSLITASIQGAILWISFTTNITKHDTWLVILAGLAVSIPFVLCYAALGTRFADQNLVQISEAILGPYLGKIIAILYICYFWLILSFNIEGFGEFLILFMPDTPSSFSIIIFTAVCAYGVFTGIETFARVGILFTSVAFVIISSTFLLLLKDMHPAAFLPFFDIPFKNFIHGMHIIITIPFCDIVIFLMIMPCLNDNKNTIKNTLLGLLLGGLAFLIVAVRNTAVLGNTEALWTSPSFEASRLINIGNILTRMDILNAIGYTLSLFFKCSIFYYGTVLSLSQLLRLRTYTPLIIPIGCITVTLSMIVYDSTIAHGISAQNVWPIVASLFTLVLPPLLLLIAKLRNLPNKKDCSDGANQHL